MPSSLRSPSPSPSPTPWCSCPNTQAVLPRLKIYASKARLRELKAEMLEARLAEQEEKLDVAAAMGWHDEAEDEADKQAR